MALKPFACILTVVFALISYMVPAAYGDIYRYKDKNGVVHFANVKSDRRYRIYIKTIKKTPAQYINQYEGIIIQAAKRFGVDRDLIKAVIKAESDFNHKAVSRKGAQGLMQLMPGTADEMDVDNPFNAEENIFGGTRYLSLLLKRFKGDTSLALAAYNAGPEAVESNKRIPRIPETQEFVKKVMRYFEIYRSKRG